MIHERSFLHFIAQDFLLMSTSLCAIDQWWGIWEWVQEPFWFIWKLNPRSSVKNWLTNSHCELGSSTCCWDLSPGSNIFFVSSWWESICEVTDRDVWPLICTELLFFKEKAAEPGSLQRKISYKLLEVSHKKTRSVPITLLRSIKMIADNGPLWISIKLQSNQFAGE